MSGLDHSCQKCDGVDLNNADVALNHSQFFRTECKRLILKTEKTSKLMQEDERKHLDQLIEDIKFLKDELELKLGQMVPEIDILAALHSRVMNALEVIKKALTISSFCMDERRSHYLSDCLHDEVNTQLLKEWYTFKEVAILLQSVQEQITEQIRLNRSTKYHLEEDLEDISETQPIDTRSGSMTVCPISYHQMSNKDITGLASSALTPKQWENSINLSKAKAEQQKRKSVSLRVLVEHVLAKVCADMQNEFKATTNILRLNIQHIKSTKRQIEEKLPKTQSEISSQQAIREALQAAITENEQFLTAAESRISQVHQNPSKKLCHDPVHGQLLTEVQQLTAHINKLRENVIKSEEQQRTLVRCQEELTEAIETKTKCLYIDEVVCMQRRKNFVIHHF